MQRSFVVRVIAVIALFLMALSGPVAARVSPQQYGVTFATVDSIAAGKEAQGRVDSLLQAGPFRLAPAKIYGIQHLRPFKNRTIDFYVLTALCMILGAIRYGDSRYFNLMIGAYRGAGNSRQLRDLLQAAALPNLGMNIFFCAVAGAYIYYITAGTSTKLMGERAPLVLPLLIAGMLLIYAGKYLVVRFSGWIFRVEPLAEEYLFNVFLVNKIIGIVLLPFVVIIAFAGQEWAQPMGIVSGAVVLALLATRYLRSWSAFYAVFKGSRFHFFTYLCASEILPMAVLVKWLLHLMN